MAPQRGEQPRVTGRDGVIAARGHRGRREEAQDRREDRAVVPEEVEERRVGRDLLRDRREQLKAGPAVQQLRERQIVRRERREDVGAGLAVDVHALQPGQNARPVRSRVHRRAKRSDLLAQRRPAGAVERRERRLLAEHPVQPDDVRRQLIARLAVRAWIGSDVQHRELQLGVSADHVVNPRRDTARHERVGPLDQQADIRHLGDLGIVVQAERRVRCAVNGRHCAPYAWPRRLAPGSGRRGSSRSPPAGAVHPDGGAR